MDETPVWYDMPSERTLEFEGAETVDIKTTGNEKTRFTTVVTITASGKVLPVYIIFGNLKKVPNEKKVKCPANVVLAVNGSGSMDEDLMCDYLEKVIKPYVSNASALLVMDSFRAHTTPKCKDKMNELELDWLIIPPGTTSLLQPCDVSINKPLKAKLREHWEEWFADEDYMFEIYTLCGNRKKQSYQCLVD